MGNCLTLQDKVIKVMKTDGEVVEYRAPIKVHQVLSEYVCHAISDTLPVERYLRKDTDMIGGQLYYLLPLPVLPQLKFEKKILPADSKLELVENGGESGPVLRIKLVMRKQELEAMLKNGGVSVSDLISQLKEKESSETLIELHQEGNENCKGWKPVLESIAEVD